MACHGKVSDLIIMWRSIAMGVQPDEDWWFRNFPRRF